MTKKKLSITFLFFASCNLITGCFIRRTPPLYEKDVTWYCEELGITLMKLFGYIDFNDELIEISLWCSNTGGSMGMYDKKYIFDEDWNWRTATDLLSGSVKYSKTKLTLYVEHDMLYDNKYSVIVFQKRTMTEEDKAYFDKRVKELEEYDRQRSSYSSQENSSVIL